MLKLASNHNSLTLRAGQNHATNWAGPREAPCYSSAGGVAHCSTVRMVNCKFKLRARHVSALAEIPKGFGLINPLCSFDPPLVPSPCNFAKSIINPFFIFLSTLCSNVCLQVVLDDENSPPSRWAWPSGWEFHWPIACTPIGGLWIWWPRPWWSLKGSTLRQGAPGWMAPSRGTFLY